MVHKDFQGTEIVLFLVLIKIRVFIIIKTNFLKKIKKYQQNFMKSSK